MIIKVPQSSEYRRVRIEVTGEDVLRCIEASTDVSEVAPFLPEDVDEDRLMVTAQFLNEAHEPMGDVIVLQEPEEPEEPEEPLDSELADWDTMSDETLGEVEDSEM